MILSVVRGNLSPRVLAESKGTAAFRLVPLRGEVSESVPRPQTVSRKSVFIIEHCLPIEYSNKRLQSI